MTLFARAAAALLAVVALTACNANDGTGAAGAPNAEIVATTRVEEKPDPTEAPKGLEACDLLTRAEAETLAGTPLADPMAVRETCSWTAPPTGPTGQVEIYVGDGAKKILEIDRELGHEFKTLSGIGDEAYLEDGSVFLLTSGTWVTIRLVRLNDPAENAGPLEAAARKVADRL